MMRYERYDMGEISNHELKMKLTSYSAKDKPLLLSAILKRREEQTQKQLKQLQIQEMELSQQLKPFPTLVIKKSQKLSGSQGKKFDQSFHFEFKIERQQESKQQEKLQCSICTLPFEQQQKVCNPYNCAHVFHSDCTEEWFGTKQDPNCPLCRSQFQSLSAKRKRLQKLGCKIKNLLERQSLLSKRFTQMINQPF